MSRRAIVHFGRGGIFFFQPFKSSQTFAQPAPLLTLSVAGKVASLKITSDRGTTGSARVFRCGAFNDPGSDCRPAKRNSAEPS